MRTQTSLKWLFRLGISCLIPFISACEMSLKIGSDSEGSNLTLAPDTSFTPFALGQPDFFTNTAPVSPTSANLGGSEFKIHSDGTRLFVSDYVNSRILIWNSIPENFQQAADVVVGQTDMISADCNRGGASPTAQTLCNQGGVYSDGTKLYVADWGNNRVLIWNSIPTTNSAPADLVLGQSNMTSKVINSGGLSASSMYQPWHLTVAAGKLFVSDYRNHRILIWNSIPTASSTAANVVVGQSNMTSNVRGNIGTPTSSSLAYPYEVISDGTKLIIADTGTFRILVWNSIPTSNGVAADVVIGQADFSSKVSGATTARSITPTSVFHHSGKLYALDGDGARLMIWNSIPTAHNAPADSVFGQPDMTSNTPNNGGISQSSLEYWAEGLYVDNTRIYIGDPVNYRILVLPTP